MLIFSVMSRKDLTKEMCGCGSRARTFLQRGYRETSYRSAKLGGWSWGRVRSLVRLVDEGAAKRREQMMCGLQRQLSAR